MFPNPKPKSKLQIAIDEVLLDMRDHSPRSDEYKTLLDRLTELEKIQAEHKPYRPSPDTLILAAVNLIGIAMIIRHENLNVITTKALSFVRMR